MRFDEKGETDGPMESARGCGRGYDQFAWAPNTHITFTGSRSEKVLNKRIEKDELKIIIDTQVSANRPEFQGPESTHRHAMRRPGQTPADARRSVGRDASRFRMAPTA